MARPTLTSPGTPPGQLAGSLLGGHPVDAGLIRMILERLPAAVYICDAEGLITFFNRPAAEVWGREPRLNDPADRFCGSFRLYRKDGTPLPHDECWMALALKRETIFEGEEVIIERNDGSRRTVLAHASPLRDDEGRLTGAINVLVDITARKDAETALQVSEVRFARFMEHLPGLAWIKDPAGRYVFANEAAARAFGRSREELYGRTDTDLFPLDTTAQFADNDRRALEAASGVDVIETMSHEDGPHHSLVSKFPIPVPDGPSYIGGIAIDITDRHLVEATLRESEARFRNMADNAPVLIWVAGLGGREYVNRETLRFLGCSLEDVRGAKWQDFIHPDDRPGYLAVHEHGLQHRDIIEGQFRLRRADGEYRWMRSTAMPRFTEDGTFLGFVGCSVDITEIKQSQDKLREADQRKDEFLATLAHELRNPLAPLRYSLEILRMEGGSPAVARVHEMMERQINHMDRLVDDLLDVSRITRGKIELRRSRVDLATVVRTALETSKPLIELADHQLTMSLPREPLVLDADPIRLAQVLANLLNNAAKYTNDGGKIWLTARREGHEVVVSIRDSGIGIPDALLHKVFGLFSQADQSVGRTRGGLGIGLTLAKRLTEMHGGRIEARSEGEGKGSEFLVTLPLAVDVPTSLTGAVSDVDGRSARPPRCRILVVDDNKDSADALGLLLEASGADVRVVYDGPSAVDAFDEHRPSIVLLDLGLPGMDGYEVAAKLRERPESRDARLIALTGWGHPEARRRSREVGFDRHLVKPVKLETLRALLASLEHGNAATVAD
jgi:PAS domain S-box-containing protein